MFLSETVCQFIQQQAWYKASTRDIGKYKCELDKLLSNLFKKNNVLYCNNVNCLQHKDELCTLYKSVINACITASSHIPRTSQSRKVIPGWSL